MRKLLFLLVLLFTLSACTLGPILERQAKSTPTDVPATAIPAATDTPALAAPVATDKPPRGGKATPTEASTASAASTQNAPGDLRGIYVANDTFPISAANEAAYSASINVPGVDGLLLGFGWKYLEPSMGQYDWSTLDKWMNTAVAAHKNVELAIRADYNTPDWLFQPAPAGAGAIPLKFSFTRKPEDTNCVSGTYAAPWDPAFLAQWDAMLAAVSAHLQSSGTYNAITLVRLTGINKDSGELHLPERASKTACATDPLPVWQKAGYRPSLLLKGWDGITSSFKKSFPDKTFSVAIIASTYPFPAIADDGLIIKGTVPNQNLPLLKLASQKFPGHLVIQNNSLYPNEPAQTETVQAAQSLGTMIAFQTNEDIRGQGASCGDRTSNRATPCTAATYLAELQTGIYPLGQTNSLRAQYIEVFALNVNDFPAVIQQAHNELLGQQ
jgi:hypothetical protein